MSLSASEAGDAERAAFFKRHSLTADEYDGTGLDWKMLQRIAVHHAGRSEQLQSTANYVVQRLQSVPEVHSLNVRIKDPDHLIAKIVRKKIKVPDSAFDIDSYHELVTDLVGIRALHLFKDEWRPIHEFITNTWELNEKPIAYYREGDPDALLRALEQAGCNVTKHQFGYRSVHYVIQSKPDKETQHVELQVRTIFLGGHPKPASRGQLKTGQ